MSHQYATRRQLPSVELTVGGREAFLGTPGLAAVHVNFLESVVGAEGPTERNMAMLSAKDRQAIAAYLKAVPPHPNGYPAGKLEPQG